MVKEGRKEGAMVKEGRKYERRKESRTKEKKEGSKSRKKEGNQDQKKESGQPEGDMSQHVICVCSHTVLDNDITEAVHVTAPPQQGAQCSHNSQHTPTHTAHRPTDPLNRTFLPSLPLYLPDRKSVV